MTVSNPVPIINLPLTVSRYRLHFIAQEPLRLPAYICPMSSMRSTRRRRVAWAGSADG